MQRGLGKWRGGSRNVFLRWGGEGARLVSGSCLAWSDEEMEWNGRSLLDNRRLFGNGFGFGGF